MTASSDARVRCPGCGALLPPCDGPTHAYVGASAGCWALFGEVMAREYGDYGYPEVHGLTVDAYMAQHPGTPSRRSIQSVAMHLIGLYLALERGYDTRRVIADRHQLLRRGATFTWLEPPASMGPLTIADVHATAALPDHERAVRAWAASVWASWDAHHAQIREWAAR